MIQLSGLIFCSIPLPPWVLEAISKNPDLVYTDKSGRRNPEYISLGCNSLPVLRGRTPIQVYSDYMRSFRERFKDYLGEVIAVRLLLPSFPLSFIAWLIKLANFLEQYSIGMKKLVFPMVLYAE